MTNGTMDTWYQMAAVPSTALESWKPHSAYDITTAVADSVHTNRRYVSV